MKTYLMTQPASGLLDIAIGIETSNARRYREWADRFRPFDVGISVLFEDMAHHCDRYGEGLRSSRPVDWAASGKPDADEIESHTEDTAGVGEHFFVVNKDMARRILASAVHTLSKARCFYKSILVTTRNIAVRQACRPRTLPHLGHMGKLHLFLEHYASRQEPVPSMA